MTMLKSYTHEQGYTQQYQKSMYGIKETTHMTVN